MKTRRAGFLLHPTSMPGPFPVGDLGPVAEAVLDWAAQAGMTLWQVLPLGPTSYGESPYGALSSFAGNPMLISPERLQADGLLPRRGVPEPPAHSPAEVPYGEARLWKDRVLRASFAHSKEFAPRALRDELEAFEHAEQNRSWLADWTLFAALKHHRDGEVWTAWPAPLRHRDGTALAAARQELADEIAFQRFVQWAFARQWTALRAAAAARGILILGDLPIYVAHDSADVWSRPDLFRLDGEGNPEVVAGVPPDYFSPDGQRWGNPLYAWDRHRAEGFRWWIARVKGSLALADVVRLDHFRGFCAAWEIPATEPTAVGGRWVRSPGAELLGALRAGLGELPLVAEDLGLITPDVEALRDDFALPGMKVLQFGFGELDSDHAPHNHRAAAVVYTGTHDNDTSRGLYESLPPAERQLWRSYLGPDGSEDWAAGDAAGALLRAAYLSVARWAVVPAQDLFGLGSEARMNIPGQAEGNWAWRALPAQFDAALAERLLRLAKLGGRLPEAAAEPSVPDYDPV